MSKKLIIGVIGCGVVGEAQAKLCEVFGHTVFRYDKFKKCSNSEFFDKVNTGDRNWENEEKIGVNSDIAIAKEECDMIFLCLPTPSTKNGISMGAFDDIMPQLVGYKGLVVIKSTVLPETCSNYAKEYDLSIAHNPEFLTEANAVVDAMQPDKIIIGVSESDKEKADMLLELYSPFIKKGCKVFTTTTVTSELAKYASNCFLAMKVSFANEWFDICKKFDGDYKVIKESLYADNRIGNTHLEVTQGRSWGGMCFPKDTVAMHKKLEALSFSDKMLYATIMKNCDYSDHFTEWWDDEGKQLI